MSAETWEGRGGKGRGGVRGEEEESLADAVSSSSSPSPLPSPLLFPLPLPLASKSPCFRPVVMPYAGEEIVKGETKMLEMGKIISLCDERIGFGLRHRRASTGAPCGVCYLRRSENTVRMRIIIFNALYSP